MLGRLILLLTVVPFIEIYLLLRIGKTIGAGPTFLLIILTGVAGAFLLRRQGASVMQDLQRQAQQNQLPAEAMMKGLFTFLGGVLLLTPGLLTDALGFSLVIPITQSWWRKYFSEQFKKGLQSGRIQYYSAGNPFGQRPPGESYRPPRPSRDLENVIDVTANKSETQRDD